MRPNRVYAALAALALLALLALPLGRQLLWRWELNPILRGRLLAERVGCVNCHLAYGRVEIPNPGSRWGTVPRLAAGNAMMYASTAAEIEEFVRFGALRAWLEDPKASRRLAEQPVRMPAYGESLSDSEIGNLTAFATAVEGVELPGGESAAAGRSLAREHGCVACHGVEGSGGLPNPDSLGGFVPGFVGRNFTDLVKSREEFDEWVLTGRSRRLEGNPVVRFFWQRQRISMPAYEGRLGDEELAKLWAWVEALRGES